MRADAKGHDAEVKLIQATLEKYGGDNGLAAAELGMEIETLRDKVKNCKRLREIWCTPENGEPKGSISPKTNLPAKILKKFDNQLITKSDKELADDIHREELKLKRGLTKMGLDKSEIELAYSLQEFNSKQFSNIVDMTTSGLMVNSIKIMTLLRKMESRMDTGFAGEDRIQEEAMVRGSYALLLAEYRKSCQMAHEGAIIRAKIKQMKKESESLSRSKPGRAGFAPLAPVQNNFHGPTQVVIPKGDNDSTTE